MDHPRRSRYSLVVPRIFFTRFAGSPCLVSRLANHLFGGPSRDRSRAFLILRVEKRRSRYWLVLWGINLREEESDRVRERVIVLRRREARVKLLVTEYIYCA